MIFRRALYPHARPLVTFLTLFSSRYHFAADHDLVHSVSQIRRYRDFVRYTEDFIWHPMNRGFLRRSLKLRISLARLRKIIKTTLPESGQDPVGKDEPPESSAAPFA